jgi:hypothetical protein
MGRAAALLCVLLLCSLSSWPAEGARDRRAGPGSSNANTGNNNGQGNGNGQSKGNGRDIDGSGFVPPGQADKTEKQKIKNGADPDAVNLLSTDPFDDETTALVEGEVSVVSVVSHCDSHIAQAEVPAFIYSHMCI